jgi:hypothetical protein
MLENKIPELILQGSLGGRRPAGKPRNRWEEEVRKDAIKLVNTKKVACSGKT